MDTSLFIKETEYMSGRFTIDEHFFAFTVGIGKKFMTKLNQQWVCLLIEKLMV